ncbi:N-acetylmuramoyl-L-alanine amidase, partial [bacterium]|nr:N-acetylmuramoyl-L-alanine amidase [bacterium]
MGLPTKLDSDGLMVPLAGFFESFALATNSRVIIGADTIRITTAGASQSGESSAQEEQKPAVKDITGQKSREKKLIVVDPGHGGKDPGAIGPSGIREKDITLAIAKYLKSELESRGYQVVLTRESDKFITLSDRSKLAN